VVKPPPFLPSDEPEKLLKAFNRLPVEKQLEIVLENRGKDRLRFLFLSEHSKELVQNLPELEIFLTIKEVGRSDAIDLVSLTTQEQFQYLLDLDSWKKDHLDPEKVVHWMEMLLECGAEQVARFVRASDPPLLCLLFIKFLHVTKLEGDPPEVLNQNLLFTLDREYFITFKKPETRVVFQPFLEILCHEDSDGYRLLLESLLRELEANVEEEGYRFRNARLADYGFPDFEQALEIYQFINPDHQKIDDKIPPRVPPGTPDKPHPTFYLMSQGVGPFFSRVLSKVTDPSEQNRLREELAGLCNKAMVAEPIDLFDVGEMERIVKKVYHYLNLGLEYLSKTEEIQALRVLKAFTLQKIFQSGVGVTLLLKRRAEAIFHGPWFEGDRERLHFLDPIDQGRFEGALRRRPGVCRNGVVEDFKNLQDVKEIETFLGRIEVVVSTLREKLNVTPAGLDDLVRAGGLLEDRSDLTFSTLFITALANRILTGRFQIETIGRSQLKELFFAVFERDEQGKGRVKMELRRKLREWTDSTESDEQRRQDLAAFWDFCLDLLEGEYGRIPPGEEIDPRYVKGLLIREEKAEGRT
jgi:hypothetical protein